MAATFVRSRNGKLALGAAALALLIVALILLLTGGNGSSKPNAAGSSLGAASTPNDSAGSNAGSSASTGPTYALGTVEDCLKTDFGGDSVSEFPASDSSIAVFHRATTVVDVESGDQGTLLFFGSSQKATAALPALNARFRGQAVSQPNGGSVVFIADENQTPDDQITVMGCVQ